jgi:hypothetical protein
VESRKQEHDTNHGQADSEPARPEGAPGRTKDLREANENVRKAQGDDAMDTPVDPQKTGNRPRFDRDR